ncbi:nuclear transport factor 2 family protein [Edaphosphingomonas haloaromaticamans]|uniref:SnoaL-like domain-containing protein n=1 Tax=Edaphosphingomonas haloaromaticamans TaxID=653954 RepID=A0A1S1HB11_9SPHN|nr:nuclear transport factor 2 family protein [Sphingomonas haloaromaticamans]OHT18826.1 hypothetical protein BHE75_00805 [Sphingomonas haloaromaticamans]
MNHNFRKLGLCIAALLAAAPAFAHDQTPAAAPRAVIAEPAARDAGEVVTAFHAALARGDQTAAASLLADDALIYESGGVERTKAEYASHHLPADAAFAKGTKRSVTRTTGNATGVVAWIASESTVTGTYKKRAINSRSTETMILRRENGVWRIAHIHWSSANAK